MAQLIGKSERTLDRSNEAKRIGEDTFKNANNTIELLKNFENSLKAQKERTAQAKKLEETIEKFIGESLSINSYLTERHQLVLHNFSNTANYHETINQKIRAARKVSFLCLK